MDQATVGRYPLNTVTTNNHSLRFRMGLDVGSIGLGEEGKGQRQRLGIDSVPVFDQISAVERV
jgi:hypothetical protein